MANTALVCVVDDDLSVRESLPDLLRVFGFEVKAYASAKEFLESGAVSSADCLVLDVSMPEMTGPELKRELDRRQSKVPVVFMTAHPPLAGGLDLPSSAGVACLIKPFSGQAIVQAIQAALVKA